MKLYTKFFVNEDKGIVICRVEAVEYCGCIFGEYVGKAVCQEGDVFDEITGRRIAETKAHMKMHRALQKASMREFVAMMKDAEKLRAEIYDRHQVLTGLEDKLHKLTKGN